MGSQKKKRIPARIEHSSGAHKPSTKTVCCTHIKKDAKKNEHDIINLYVCMVYMMEYVHWVKAIRRNTHIAYASFSIFPLVWNTQNVE